MKKPDIHVEIFPALKSCEQGCVSCPMARKGRAVLAKTIDKDVQETFSILENILKKKENPYTLHFTSSLDLFPNFEFPELVQTARFETSKDLRLDGGASLFSDSLKSLVSIKKMNPKTIAFSLVPESMIVSENDISVIREIVQGIQKWHDKPNSGIEVTIRSNLVKLEAFEGSLDKIFSADFNLMRGLMGEFTLNSSHVTSIDDEFDHRIYVNYYKGKLKKRKLMLHNRVIGEKKINKTTHNFLRQSFFSLPRKSYSMIDFAIAPKGVMLMHSSLAINNPILWVSHLDFRQKLQFEFEHEGENFSFLKFINKIVKENQIMYMHLAEESKPFDSMHVFENSRSYFNDKN